MTYNGNAVNCINIDRSDIWEKMSRRKGREMQIALASFFS